MSEVVLGVDSSTQSCTVEVRDLVTGALVSTGRASHPATRPPVSEQRPESWWQALVTAVRDALRGHDVRVRGIGVGAQCHAPVLTGADGQVLRAAKLWNDTTSAPQAAAMLRAWGPGRWTAEVGISLLASVTVAKLAWLAEHEPETLARARRIAVPHDWLTFMLTGRHVTDRSDASGTGYFTAETMTWRTEILEEFVGERDWLPMLPHVLGPDEAAGTLTPAAAAELGVDPDVVVSAGGGDQHLAAQGIGLEEGEIAYSLGTSGVVLATSPHRVADPAGQVDGVANVTGGYLPLVCTLNATKVTDAFARLLGVGHDELSRLALAAPLAPDRPVLAAYLDGERSPQLPQARGMLSGLSGDVTREQLALAAVEGVALGLLRGERLLRAHGIEASGRSLLVGGGARSAAYRQVIADLTGRPAVTVDAPEGTARGAAVQAAAVVRHETVAGLTREWSPPVTSCTEPVADRSAVWERYLRLADLQSTGETY
ncbi:xylulokinase [Phycicoccus endophyticus]|uniref:Xylulose kinase n=1 Tax=Phycicoccus endophyticus TaxID=1690220 RepID=A0A7G9R017_9MICO|nr:xylulokinase [Phycicoccus endophyticus]NHI20806.1 xylulokinase [Phycicoccus endophyticus]QNN48942.1 xylulokinase [Phycicoccus endophyticus]GGL44126.1 xylulokinase [Phycicoccus endophyticus]